LETPGIFGQERKWISFEKIFKKYLGTKKRLKDFRWRFLYTTILNLVRLELNIL
jgi:hypothetical protein